MESLRGASENLEYDNEQDVGDGDYLVGEGENCKDNGELYLTEMEALEANNDPLARLLREKEEENEMRRMERCETRVKDNKRRNGKRSKYVPGLTVEDKWLAEVSRRSDEFYYGKEAKLLVPRQIIRKRAGRKTTSHFKSINVNEENNKDVGYIGDACFGNIARNGEGAESWDQFRIVTGQFLRACVAYHRVDLNNAWRPGAFLKVASDKFIFQAFLQHFTGRAAAASVMNKAKLLGRFAKGAILFFSKKELYAEPSENRAMQAKMEETLIYLNQMANENSKVSKIKRSRMKEEGPRVDINKYIPEKDFDDFRLIALKHLRGILDTS